MVMVIVMVIVIVVVMVMVIVKVPAFGGAVCNDDCVVVGELDEVPVCDDDGVGVTCSASMTTKPGPCDRPTLALLGQGYG